jgi:hypothetical protein
VGFFALVPRVIYPCIPSPAPPRIQFQMANRWWSEQWVGKPRHNKLKLCFPTIRETRYMGPRKIEEAADDIYTIYT